MLLPERWLAVGLFSLLCSVAAAQSSRTPNPTDVIVPIESKGEASLPKRPSITIELNKLEAASNTCRGYFIVGNWTPEALKELRLDVFLFDRKGLILRRVGLTFLDIRSDRRKVVLFDIPELPCSDIGRLLVNDVLSCTGSDGAPVEGCDKLITASTRAHAEFGY